MLLGAGTEQDFSASLSMSARISAGQVALIYESRLELARLLYAEAWLASDPPFRGRQVLPQCLAGLDERVDLLVQLGDAGP